MIRKPGEQNNGKEEGSERGRDREEDIEEDVVRGSQAERGEGAARGGRETGRDTDLRGSSGRGLSLDRQDGFFGSLFYGSHGAGRDMRGVAGWRRRGWWTGGRRCDGE